MDITKFGDNSLELTIKDNSCFVELEEAMSKGVNVKLKILAAELSNGQYREYYVEVRRGREMRIYNGLRTLREAMGYYSFIRQSVSNNEASSKIFGEDYICDENRVMYERVVCWI